jgi:hypothetical protein
MLGRDPELIRLFCNIKTELYWFSKSFTSIPLSPRPGLIAEKLIDAGKDRLSSEDTLFQTLVLENENKLVTARIKAAKRQGIL